MATIADELNRTILSLTLLSSLGERGNGVMTTAPARANCRTWAESRLKNRAGAVDIKLAQNIALHRSQKSLRLILVGANSTVRIT
jgi:hypothetical protein